MSEKKSTKEIVVLLEKATDMSVMSHSADWNWVNLTSSTTWVGAVISDEVITLQTNLDMSIVATYVPMHWSHLLNEDGTPKKALVFAIEKLKTAHEQADWFRDEEFSEEFEKLWKQKYTS